MSTPGEALAPQWFDRPPEVVARELLGCTLHCRGASAVIVETEAYHESEPASHSYRGRTAANSSLFGPPGTCYVYFTYGMHWCANAVTGAEGEGAAVLLRAAVPIDGIDLMRERRAARRKPGSAPLRDRDLCSGPAKLVQALGIEPGDDGCALVEGADGPAPDRDGPRLVRDPRLAARAGIDLAADGRVHEQVAVAVGPRIGISVAIDLPWRFGIAGSPYLSRRF